MRKQNTGKVLQGVLNKCIIDVFNLQVFFILVDVKQSKDVWMFDQFIMAISVPPVPQKKRRH